jgi:3-deoxy-D-manno-octulosonic acid kinase
MNRGDYADELPGFAAVEEGRWWILARRGLAGWARAVVRREVDTLLLVQGGRVEHAAVGLPEGGGAVVRRYRRGGLIRHVNRARYFVGHRAFEELRVTERAREAGVRVPEVLAAAERRLGVGYEALIATRWIEGAVGIDGWIPGRGVDEAGLALRRAGEQIRRMHDAGIAHPDLNLRNLLVGTTADADSPSVYLIDFDRARLSARPVEANRRSRDLNRLARSARKLGVPLESERSRALREGYGPDWPPGAGFP